VSIAITHSAALCRLTRDRERAATVTGLAMPAIAIINFIVSARHAHLHYVQSTCIAGLTLIRAAAAEAPSPHPPTVTQTPGSPAHALERLRAYARMIALDGRHAALG